MYDSETFSSDVFSPQIWSKVSQKLLAKLIEEFVYELILKIEPDLESGWWLLNTRAGIYYKFQAREYIFNNISIEPESLLRIENGTAKTVFDPLNFITEIAPALGIKPMTAAYYIKELSNTLLADAHIAVKATATAAQLAELDDIHLEGETTGHPWITVNKGRLGLGYNDYAVYAPENQTPCRILWLAVSVQKASFVAENGIGSDDLARSALGDPQYDAFLQKIKRLGIIGHEYFLMPVHPWQWDKMIVSHFATDIAARYIIPLGEGNDLYLPQQSVRTLSNASFPEKSTIKLSMTIFNTVIYRGIPRKRALTAAPLTSWLDKLVRNDVFLSQECRLILLGERAGMHYQHPQFAKIDGAPYQFNEMLACVWRDSVASHLEASETGVPFAALLHSGSDGVPVIVALANKAGVSIEHWLTKFFNVVCPPLYHFIAKYGLAFSAHGQNATLILKNGLPERLALRDFIDDINVCDLDFPEIADMPKEVRAVLLRLPPEGIMHFYQTTLFICVFRYISVLLERFCSISEETFWGLVKASILTYQKRFPELSDRFAIFDLFHETYPRLCLNRIRLFTHGYADDAERPIPDFQGTVRNPLNVFAVDEL